LDPKTKKILLLAGAGVVGLFILTQSVSQEEDGGTLLSRTPPTFPTDQGGGEIGTPAAPSAPNITYNLPSFPDPAPIPSFDYGLIDPAEFFSEPDSGSMGLASPPSTKKQQTVSPLIGGKLKEAAIVKSMIKEGKPAETIFDVPFTPFIGAIPYAPKEERASKKETKAATGFLAQSQAFGIDLSKSGLFPGGS